MALININKLKETATLTIKEASKLAQQAANGMPLQTSELGAKALNATLKGVDFNALLTHVDEYRQKTGKDTSQLVTFIDRLKHSAKDQNNDMLSLQTLTQNLQLSKILDTVEDVSKYIPTAKLPLKAITTVLQQLQKK